MPRTLAAVTRPRASFSSACPTAMTRVVVWRMPRRRCAAVYGARVSGDVALRVLDLVGIFVFGITGALVGVRKRLDVFGVLVLALVTGLGGGFIRDVLIGATPPAALVDWWYLVVPVAAGLLTFFLHPGIGRVERLVNIFDAA